MAFTTILSIAVVLGVVCSMAYWFVMNAVEKQIQTETDPVAQQLLWQNYATWQNKDLPQAVRNTGLQAINAHFEAKKLK